MSILRLRRHVAPSRSVSRPAPAVELSQTTNAPRSPSNRQPMHRLSLAALPCLVVLTTAAGTVPESNDPGARTGHCLVETPEGVVHLLGGQLWRNAPPDAVSELWWRSAGRWQRVPGSALAERYLNGAVFDHGRRRLLAFWNAGAGRGERALAWDGRRWRAMSEGQAVPLHYGLAYDGKRGRVVRFGGSPAAPGDGWPRTTSEFAGNLWRDLSTTGPDGRVLNCGSLVYDRAREVVVLFGGLGRPSGTGQPLYGDTWRWNGTTWSRVATSGPSPRAAHALAFDRREGVVLLYGGGSLDQGFGDMWRWDGRSWTQVQLSGETPGPRRGHAMAFDESTDRVVLYGGDSGGTLKNDTWEWDGRSWRAVQ